VLLYRSDRFIMDSKASQSQLLLLLLHDDEMMMSNCDILLHYRIESDFHIILCVCGRMELGMDWDVLSDLHLPLPVI
jgi:hypothetical protein